MIQEVKREYRQCFYNSVLCVICVEYKVVDAKIDVVKKSYMVYEEYQRDSYGNSIGLPESGIYCTCASEAARKINSIYRKTSNIDKEFFTYKDIDRTVEDILKDIQREEDKRTISNKRMAFAKKFKELCDENNVYIDFDEDGITYLTFHGVIRSEEVSLEDLI